MKKLEHHLKNIYSSNIDRAIESIYALAMLRLKEELQSLVILLTTTNSPAIRNAAALALADIGDQKVLPILVSLISDPKTENYRGTLVHALQSFDCSEILSFLVHLVIDGNFEVSHEAFQVIEKIDGDVDENEFEECLSRINKAISVCKSEEKKSFLEDLKEIFMENQ